MAVSCCGRRNFCRIRTFSNITPRTSSKDDLNMAAPELSGDLQNHRFEVLLYTFFDSWTGFAYDDYDVPVHFDTVQDALEDLQEAFDIWQSQIDEGERMPDQGFSPDEFAIRSLNTG